MAAGVNRQAGGVKRQVAATAIRKFRMGHLLLLRTRQAHEGCDGSECNTVIPGEPRAKREVREGNPGVSHYDGVAYLDPLSLAPRGGARPGMTSWTASAGCKRIIMKIIDRP